MMKKCLEKKYMDITGTSINMINLGQMAGMKDFEDHPLYHMLVQLQLISKLNSNMIIYFTYM